MTPLWMVNLTRWLKTIFGALPPGIPDEWQLLPPLSVDKDGWLVGDGVTHVPMHKSWRYAGLNTPEGTPNAVVWHYTATDPGTAEGMARRRQKPWTDFAAEYRKDNPGKTVPQNSWHLSIETYGGIVQMAPLITGTWHVGSDTAIPIKGLGWANRVSNGIELVGHGKAFPQAQVIDAARVLAAIVDAYKVERKYAMIQHAQLDGKRRSDPGPVWMSKHADHVLEYAYSKLAT